jgi:hypothetical protein
MYAAESTIAEAKDRATNWFDASESIIWPLCDTAQCAYKNFLSDGSDGCEPTTLASLPPLLPPSGMSSKEAIL